MERWRRGSPAPARGASGLREARAALRAAARRRTEHCGAALVRGVSESAVVDGGSGFARLASETIIGWPAL